MKTFVKLKARTKLLSFRHYALGFTIVILLKNSSVIGFSRNFYDNLKLSNIENYLIIKNIISFKTVREFCSSAS